MPLVVLETKWGMSSIVVNIEKSTELQKYTILNVECLSLLIQILYVQLFNLWMKLKINKNKS